MPHKKRFYWLCIFLFSFEIMFANIAYAGIFTGVRNAVVHPIAIHYCERHARNHFSASSAEKVCACTWNKLVSVKGEISAVIAQVTHHKSNASLKLLERQQIIACADQYHVGRKTTRTMHVNH